MDCNVPTASSSETVPIWPFRYKIVEAWVSLGDPAARLSTHSVCGGPPEGEGRRRLECSPQGSEEAECCCLSVDDSVVSTGQSPSEWKAFQH